MALTWISLRTLLMLSQVHRHGPGAQLGRRFQQELRRRGLITGSADADRLMR